MPLYSETGYKFLQAGTVLSKKKSQLWLIKSWNCHCDGNAKWNTLFFFSTPEWLSFEWHRYWGKTQIPFIC